MKTRVGQLVRWLLVERELDENIVAAWDRSQLLHAAHRDLEEQRDAELAAVHMRYDAEIKRLSTSCQRAFEAHWRIRAKAPGIDAHVRRAWRAALHHSSLQHGVTPHLLLLPERKAN